MRETRFESIASLVWYINSQGSRWLVTPLSFLHHCRSLTPKNNNAKRGASRARQNKTPRSDAITLRGRQRVTVVADDGSGVINFHQAVSPYTLGDRVAGVAVFFERYRFRTLKFELRSKLPTTTYGTYIHGVSDDAFVTGSPPTPTEQEILDFRVSAERHTYSDSTLRWSPLDGQKWYYVDSNHSGAPDPADRFVESCTYFLETADLVAQPSQSCFSLDIHYVVEFAGGREDQSQGLLVPLPITPMGQQPPPVLAQKSTVPRR